MSEDHGLADGNVLLDIDHPLSVLRTERTPISQIHQNIETLFVVGACCLPIL